MAHRRHGSTPSYALWTLVGIGDLALLVANVGVTVLIALCAILTLGLAGFGASVVKRSHNRVPVPVKRDA